MCTHHWRIEPPDGTESHAICTKCGEEKMFSNAPATTRPANGDWRRRGRSSEQGSTTRQAA